MTSETLHEIYRALRTGQEKYIYFLLAAAGAAITLAVNKTQAASLAWSQLPLAGAVLSWALSFYFGCRHLALVNSTLYANYDLIRVEAGQHPRVGTHPDLMTAASEGIREAIQTNSDNASQLAHWQFRFLVSGGVFYLFWHVLEMYLRST